MLSIKGIYENGGIKLLEQVTEKGRFKVIITFLEDEPEESTEKENLGGLLSDLDDNDFDEFLQCCQRRSQDWFRGRTAEL